MTQQYDSRRDRSWSTVDEMKYLQGVRARRLDWREVLESWLETCRKRHWPVSVDVRLCERKVMDILGGGE